MKLTHVIVETDAIHVVCII